ncbi:MAG TPA: RDD family protein [Thermoanaerobaculia bacterium]|nr:RDD family protein [Thermoanaerobaculia bacterium]
MRFDEIELEPVPLGIQEEVPAAVPAGDDAPRGKRLLALLTDLSMFVALVLALSPLLPQPYDWTHIAALAGFVVVISYYYFVGTWMLWGKTIGGAIFDVRVVPAHDRAMSLRDASTRWAALYLSLATAGLGLALAALPSRQSLPDRMSETRCVTA